MMKRLTVVFSLAVAVGGASNAQTLPLVPPSESVAGMSQAEWSRAWWQWAGSFDRAESPVADLSGDHCHLKQQGPVWFLAGTYGTRRTVRTCEVPQGKYLFFPLINYVVYPRSGTTPGCLSIKASAAEVTDDASLLLLEVDGIRADHLNAHRQATDQCFDLKALHPGAGRLSPAAANGYYVMLKPLPSGTHTLNFGGALPSMLQAVTYTLHVR